MKARLLWMALLVGIAGCLDKEETHTLYLESDGTVTWTVTESLVRSVDGDITQREAEERDFMADALAGKNEAAERMRKVGAYGVETRVVRSRRPYAVTTEGHFTSLESLLRAQLAGEA